MANITEYASELLLDFSEIMYRELTATLKTAYGESWLEKGVKKHFPDEHFARVEKMLTSPNRVIDMGQDESELYGVEHIWNIVNGNWHLFSDKFEDKKRSEVYFGEITELRHNLAHRRKRHLLPRQNLLRFAQDARILLECLGATEVSKFSSIEETLISGGSDWGTSLAGHLPPYDDMYLQFIGRNSELDHCS